MTVVFVLDETINPGSVITDGNFNPKGNYGSEL